MSSSNLRDVVPYFAVGSVILVNIVLYLANENSILRFCINLRGRLLRVTNSINRSRLPNQFLCWDILNPEDTVEFLRVHHPKDDDLCHIGQWGCISQGFTYLQNSGTDFIWIHNSVSGHSVATGFLHSFLRPEQGLWGSGFSSPTFNWLIYFTNWTYVGFGLYWVSGITILLIVRDMHLYVRHFSPFRSCSS